MELRLAMARTKSPSWVDNKIWLTYAFSGATNRPQDLDEAARRRLTKRIYVPLPDHPARKRLIETLIRVCYCGNFGLIQKKKENHALLEHDINFLAESTDGFSGNDLSNLCADAAMGPLREQTNIEYIPLEDLRPLSLIDFQNSLKKIKVIIDIPLHSPGSAFRI